MSTTTQLAGIRNVSIDEAAVRAHVMRPAHTEGVISSRGLEDETRPVATFSPAANYHFEVKEFGDALHAKLKNAVAGYVMQLRQNGSTIYTEAELPHLSAQHL